MGRSGIRKFGVFMLVATILALWFNIAVLTVGYGSPTMTAILGLFVGLGGYIVGETTG